MSRPPVSRPSVDGSPAGGDPVGGSPGRRLFRLPAGRRRAAADVGTEIRLHLELCEADLVAAGLTPEAARAEARRRFGDPDATAAECVAIEGERQARLAWRDRLGALAQDVGYAARTLRRAPGFALVVVLTLGLGIGATTAMFSVVDAVLLRPLPLPAAERVVALVPEVAGAGRGGSPGLLAAWGGGGSRTLAVVGAFTDRHATLAGPDGAERLAGLAVSGRFAEALGVQPALGRTIRPADDVPGAPLVAVVSHRFWRGALAGDPAAVGRAVRLDGAPHTVVGVLPRSLDPVLGERAYWVPLALDPSQRDNFTPYLELVARIAPGATRDAAAAELTAITRRLGPRAADEGAYPTIRVERLDRHWSGDYRRPLLLMLAAVAAVLAIACANVATLVLVRSVGRSRELAVRASLGAGRGRLVRQLVVEHLVLGGLAAGAAVPAAWAGVRALAAAAPAEVPRLAGAGLDGRALAIAAALGVGTGLLCGVAPALHRRRLDVGGALRGGGRAVTDARGERWRRVLVGAEVALAAVLLTGAGLFVRSAAALGRVRPGFDVERVLTARLALPERDYPAFPAAVRGYEAILDAARRQPGVAVAALVSRVPLGGSGAGVDVAPVGAPLARGVKFGAALRLASPDYFRTMGIPLLAGRDLRAADDARAAPVAVVNVALARRLAGGAPPAAAVGRRFRSDNSAFADAAGRPREIEVVGVVGDVLDGGPRGAPAPEFYAPLAQSPEESFNYWIGRQLVLAARAEGGRAPAALAPALRRAAASVDGRVPLYGVRTAGERLGGALAVERFSTRLLLLLGAAGLLLAALGVHGVVAYAAGRRAPEVGVRLALGASPSGAAAPVARQAMRPVALGLAAGAAGAALAWRAAAGLLFGVSPLDPVSLAGAAALLAGVGALACYAPARRVARVDPALTLRGE